MSPPSGAGRAIIWRFQSGPMLHLGVSASGSVKWQKLPISGEGRLSRLDLHLAADVSSGRLLAEICRPGESDAAAFLARALANADRIGGKPDTIVFSREIARENPRLVEVASQAGATPAFGTRLFRQRQKISRHFEEFLGSQICGHSQLGSVQNLIACVPSLVSAWNVTGQSADTGDQRYSLGASAVDAALGPDPRDAVERAFHECKLDLRDIAIVPGTPPRFTFSNSYGDTYGYFGHDLRFAVGGVAHIVPLFVASVSELRLARSPRLLRNFDPGSILLRKGDVSVELRDQWRRDEKQLDQAIDAKEVLRTMAARGGHLAEISAVLRKIIAAWITSTHLSGVSFPRRLAEIQPAPEIRAAGVSFGNESWERIRERHFWRVTAFWETGVGAPAPFARVQIESDGRLNVLPDRSHPSDTGERLNEFLAAVFLKVQDMTVAPTQRSEIVARLRENAASRSSR